VTLTAQPVKAASEAAAPKKSFLKSKKGIMLIVGVLVVVFVAYKFFLAPKPKPGPPAPGDIVSLQANTLNLTDGHYLKIAVDVQLVKGKATVTSFQVSNAEQLVINEFSDRTVVSLSTNPAREALTTQLETAMKKAYPGEIYQIYLTQFVTQ
jgi:flagellar protein FliL